MPDPSPGHPASEGAPHHTPAARPSWFERGERIRKEMLTWADVRELSIFGRNGYYVRNYLFASLPVFDPELDVWARLPDADAATYGAHPQALPSPHGVRGWIRLKAEDDAGVDAVLNAVKKAYEAACSEVSKGDRDHVGVPVEQVPEATGQAEHKVPQGPYSGRFKTGLVSKGAMPQAPDQRGSGKGQA